jgi:hypothetical protein
MTVSAEDAMVAADGAVDPDMGMVMADAMVEMDMAIIEEDAAMDAEIPDAAPLPPDADPIVVPGMDCMADDECGDFERCLSNACQIDLRPEVFVIDTVEVTQPENSAGLLQGALQGVIAANQLNLVVEPGGYQGSGDYRWYVGNGGLRDATFDYLGQYPIQNFDGFWREKADGTRYWRMEGDTPFVLNVPAGQVQTADGGVFTCMTAFNVTVEMSIIAELDDAGNPSLNMVLIGYLLEADARTVNFQFNGVEVALISLLDPTDMNIDTDGDGAPDAYPFDFSGTAAAVTFIGDPPAADGSNRNPEANVDNPPECTE